MQEGPNRPPQHVAAAAHRLIGDHQQRIPAVAAACQTLDHDQPQRLVRLRWQPHRGVAEVDEDAFVEAVAALENRNAIRRLASAPDCACRRLPTAVQQFETLRQAHEKPLRRLRHDAFKQLGVPRGVQREHAAPAAGLRHAPHQRQHRRGFALVVRRPMGPQRLRQWRDHEAVPRAHAGLWPLALGSKTLRQLRERRHRLALGIPTEDLAHAIAALATRRRHRRTCGLARRQFAQILHAARLGLGQIERIHHKQRVLGNELRRRGEQIGGDGFARGVVGQVAAEALVGGVQRDGLAQRLGDAGEAHGTAGQHPAHHVCHETAWHLAEAGSQLGNHRTRLGVQRIVAHALVHWSPSPSGEPSASQTAKAASALPPRPHGACRLRNPARRSCSSRTAPVRGGPYPFGCRGSNARCGRCG